MSPRGREPAPSGVRTRGVVVAHERREGPRAPATCAVVAPCAPRSAGADAPAAAPSIGVPVSPLGRRHGSAPVSGRPRSQDRSRWVRGPRPPEPGRPRGSGLDFPAISSPRPGGAGEAPDGWAGSPPVRTGGAACGGRRGAPFRPARRRPAAAARWPFGCGWPAFARAYAGITIAVRPDTALDQVRELKARCGIGARSWPIRSRNLRACG
jgi:hypothetical protein